jgi:hypothetical protein
MRDEVSHLEVDFPLVENPKSSRMFFPSHHIYSVSLSLIDLIIAAAAQTGKPHLADIILCI